MAKFTSRTSGVTYSVAGDGPQNTLWRMSPEAAIAPGWADIPGVPPEGKAAADMDKGFGMARICNYLPATRAPVAMRKHERKFEFHYGHYEGSTALRVGNALAAGVQPLVEVVVTLELLDAAERTELRAPPDGWQRLTIARGLHGVNNQNGVSPEVWVNPAIASVYAGLALLHEHEGTLRGVIEWGVKTPRGSVLVADAAMNDLQPRRN